MRDPQQRASRRDIYCAMMYRIMRRRFIDFMEKNMPMVAGERPIFMF